ncbi:MAG TPA: prolyl oligopeptidase family serine peptidase [Caulobacteraceae bacterium]|jgi:dipeptidyl aminopeptidase/acylaminoacyl peptidase
MSRLLTGMALGLAMVAATAVARPFTIDDMLEVESIGGAYLAPGGRWLVVEHARPYDTAKTYDDDVFESLALSRLDIIDLTGDEVPQPLLPGDAGDGLNPGPFSPDGRWMAVFRLQGHQWELGLADLGRRQVRWLGLTVEPGNWGRTVQWRSDNQLVAIAVTDGGQPGRINRYWAAEARPPKRWSAATAGTVATDTVVGSGRFLPMTPQGPRMALVEVDAVTGARRLLSPGNFLDLEISPGGRYVAALGEDDAHQPKSADVLRIGTSERRRGLTVVDLTSGEVKRPCGELDVASHLLSWSPDGARLLVFTKDDPGAWNAGALRDVDAAANACTAAPMAGVRPTITYDQLLGFPLIRADWMGDDPIVLSESTAPDLPHRSDWRRLAPGGSVNLTAAIPAAPPKLLAVGASGILLIGQTGLWRSDASGQVRHLDAAFNRPVIETSPGDGDRLSYVADRGSVAWVRDGERIALASADGVGAARAIPPAGLPLVATPDLIVAKVTDPDGVSAVVADRDGQQRRLLEVNRSYAGIGFSRIVAIPFVGAREETLTAWLYLPADLPPAAKAPLLVMPYPGAVYTTAPREYAPGSAVLEVNPHLLTAAGYAVLVPSMPRDWSNHEPAAGLADQVLAAVDAAAKVAQIDPDRLALWGHSYGGYASLAIATQTDRFKSVIESSGKSDLISAYGPFIPASRAAPEDGTSPINSMGWMENGQGDLGVAPAQDIDLYARNSPAFHADRITAPVLLIHGDMDFVPLAQGEEMFSALYRQDKDAVLVTLWGEGHNATSPANVRKMYAWILWWLGQTLGPGASSASSDALPMPRPGLDGEQLDKVAVQVTP